MLISNGEILEVLYGARRRLENPRSRVQFSDWTACACGHIYAATNERVASNPKRVAAADGRDERYSEIIMAVARALGWDGTGEGRGFSDWATTPVAHAAGYVSRSTGSCDRSGMIGVVQRAIDEIETMQERDRLDVLARTQRIVDEAVAPEHAPV